MLMFVSRCMRRDVLDIFTEVLVLKGNSLFLGGWS